MCKCKSEGFCLLDLVDRFRLIHTVEGSRGHPSINQGDRTRTCLDVGVGAHHVEAVGEHDVVLEGREEEGRHLVVHVLVRVLYLFFADGGSRIWWNLMLRVGRQGLAHATTRAPFPNSPTDVGQTDRTHQPTHLPTKFPHYLGREPLGVALRLGQQHTQQIPAPRQGRRVAAGARAVAVAVS